jgi:Flp pilus assembly pilin Flp
VFPLHEVTMARPKSNPLASRSLRALRRQKLLRDRRGAAMTEYVALLGTVCISMAAAIAALGPHLVANYERSQGILLSPFP